MSRDRLPEWAAPVPSAFSRFALSFVSSLSASAEDQALLAELIADRAFEVVGRDADHALELDDAHPGYLRRDLPLGSVHVPFNLAPVFPGRAVLDPIQDVATVAVVSRESMICLGGSATFTGSLRAISDLDLCEYNAGDPSEIAAAVGTLVESSDAVVEVKCAGESWGPPWTDLGAALQLKLVDLPPHPPAHRMKLDLIADAGALGIVPLTNVVLPIGDDPESGNAHSSFVYQEAVLAMGGPPVRGLLDPAAFGAYLRWLRTQVQHYGADAALAETPIGALKALKRTLSFFLAIGLEELVQETIEILNSPEVEALLLALRREETLSLAGRLPDPAGASWSRRIASETTKPATGEECAATAAALGVLVRSFVQEVEQFSQIYGAAQ